MLISEFYNPEKDQMTPRSKSQSRKQRLTLKDLSKLRRARELKRLEKAEYDEFVKVMYGSNNEAPATGGLF